MTEPSIPKDSVEDLQDHILLASRMRPDINQAKLQEQKGELEIVRTKNGLLPKLDLFIQLGRTGYSKTFSGTLLDYSEGDGGADLLGRLKLEFPFLNRRAKAEYNRSLLEFTKQKEAVENLIQLAQQDVLLAYVEIHRAKDQMRTSSSLIKVQLEKRKAEIEKYRLGSSTADKVAQAEKDTVTAELSALQARIDYLKGLTQFYVAEGSLLPRRGIALVNVSY
jgi:outer membrane protein TolC